MRTVYRGVRRAVIVQRHHRDESAEHRGEHSRDDSEEPQTQHGLIVVRHGRTIQVELPGRGMPVGG